MSDGGGDATTPTSNRPVAVGSLGRTVARRLYPAQTVVGIVAVVVAIVAASAAISAFADPLDDAFGPVLAAAILVLLAWLIFLPAVAAYAFLPPFLVAPRDRAAFVVMTWILAREKRRIYGSAARGVRLPRDASSAEAWLADHPPSDRDRSVRIGALLFARRFDDARHEAALLPETTPIERFRKLDALATVEDQTGGDVDEAGLQAAVAAVPPGVEHAEAAATLAVFRARRCLPDGDWRAVLLEVRPLIPDSNARVILVEYGPRVFVRTLRSATVLAIAVALIAVIPRLRA